MFRNAMAMRNFDTLGTAKAKRRTEMKGAATARLGTDMRSDGKVRHRRAGHSKGKEKQLQCEEIHLRLILPKTEKGVIL